MENGQAVMIRTEFVRQLASRFAHTPRTWVRELLSLVAMGFPAFFLLALVWVISGVATPGELLLAYCCMIGFMVIIYALAFLEDFARTRGCIHYVLAKNPSMRDALSLSQHVGWIDDDEGGWNAARLSKSAASNLLFRLHGGC